MKNKQIILKKRPTGMPKADTWALVENEVTPLKKGEIRIENHYVSLDPAMRGWMNEGKSYIPPVAIDDVMRAGNIGVVIESNEHSEFNVGDVLTGWGGVQQYVTTDGKGYFKVDTSLVPMTTYLATLGMPGMTAYFGILEVGKIKAGDVVLISGAAGAVGSVAGQIAKIKGCTVVGIAGGTDKCKYVVSELGFNACIDYKNENIYKKIKEYCPDGIDVYFDNVGGDILDSALANLRMNARVVICGAISQYNNMQNVQGPKNYLSLLVNRATMQGMVVFDYAHSYQDAGHEMGTWIMQGQLKSEEDIYEGIENFYNTFLRLFSGDKRGKLLLKTKV
jgi:NADPH-dependent curcumin reductase CurA